MQQLLLLILATGILSAHPTADLARHLRDLDPHLLSDPQRQQTVGMIQRDIRRRRARANAENRADVLRVEQTQAKRVCLLEVTDSLALRVCMSF